jgi:MFS-type transporter involved in bile tolerance (Atg22 family)
VALAAAYNLQALLCFVVPVLFGTDLSSVLFLLFAVNLLGQVSGPTESSVIPFVASEEELASSASLVSLSSNLGTAFGTAILAPIVVRAFGVDAVLYLAGVLLFLAATRVFDLTTRQRIRRLDWRRPNVNVRATIGWLAHEPAVGTMIIVSVLAGVANIILQTLAPRYVASVLDVDPADAVYVFAPSAIGLGLALLAGPRLIPRFGERAVALFGFVALSGSLCLLGFVDQIGGAFGAFNPLRALSWFGIEISENMRTAGLLAMFVGFGLSLTTTSVQTYLNRRVPLSYQGRAFALQSMLKNASAIVPLLMLGAIATVTSVEAILIVTPVLLLALAFALVRVSYALGGERAARGLDVLSSFWEESHEPVRVPSLAHEASTKTQHDQEHHPA